MKIRAFVYELYHIERMGLRCKGRYAMNINPLHFQVCLAEGKGGMDFDLLTPLPLSPSLAPPATVFKVKPLHVAYLQLHW